MVDDGRFEVVAGQLKLTAGTSLDHETESPTINVLVTSTDSGSETTQQTFTITVVDVNEAPTTSALRRVGVECRSLCSAVGYITTTDVDAGDSHTYVVDDGRFEVLAGQPKLTAGTRLDLET